MILAPETLGETIRETAQSLAEHGQKMTPQSALYAEKSSGFECRSCC